MKVLVCYEVERFPNGGDKIRKITKIGSMLVIVVVFSLVMSVGTAMAQTDFHSEWDGSGSISQQFSAGDDADVSLDTWGNQIVGEFNASDKNNNPYGYGVDHVNANVDATVNDGGRITFEFERTDSKESMYGPAGQESFSMVMTDDFGEIEYRSGMNYASMRNSEYEFNNDKQFRASGSNFTIDHILRDSDDDGASIHVVGDGKASVTSMGEEASGSSFEFGKGTGCFLNQSVEAEGEGFTNIYAGGSNYLNGDGWEMPNGGSHSESWNYDDGVSVEASDIWSEGH